MTGLLRVLLLVLPVVLAGQTRWYPSDALGTWKAVEPSSEPGRGWWVGVSEQASLEKQVLVRDGAETQQRWLEFDDLHRPASRRTFVSGVLTSEVAYAAGTTLVESETVYQDGQVSSRIRYTWSTLGLRERRAEDASGALLWTDRVYRYPDGRLRRLERTGPQGPLAQISWTQDAQGRPQSWVVDEDLQEAGRHKVVTQQGDGTREDLFAQGDLLESRLLAEHPDGTSSQKETQASTGAITDRLLDDRGRLIRQTVTLKDKLPQTTRWTWDEHDRVVHDETEIRGGLETTDYTYAEDGTSVVTKRRLGVLTSRETRQDGEKVLVELFDQGKKFLEEVWANGRKTLERYYQDDQVVRERQR